MFNLWVGKIPWKLKLDLLHCRQILYHLCYQGSHRDALLNIQEFDKRINLKIQRNRSPKFNIPSKTYLILLGIHENSDLIWIYIGLVWNLGQKQSTSEMSTSSLPGQAESQMPCFLELQDQDNHSTVITHLEPDILGCEAKWALDHYKQSQWR